MIFICVFYYICVYIYRKSANVTPNKITKSSSGGDLTKLDAMLIRDEKLAKSENLTGKFLEVN